MQFKELSKGVLANAYRYSEKHKIEFNEEFVLLKLVEELGEYIQSALIYKKKCRGVKYLPVDKAKEELAKELADVVGLAIVNADKFEIDLETALQEKWIKHGELKK